MNKGLVRYILGWVLVVIAVMLLLPMIVAIIYRESCWAYFLLLSGCCGLLGGISSKFKPKNTQMYPRDGYVSCALAWILLSVIGCLPFYISGEIPSFTNALFESVSGFTTTGATILGNGVQIEDLSHGMLFWRSFTNWAGGMGILVFMLAVISPLSGQSNMYLMKAESPGPVVSKLIPKLKGTAVLLYGMYIFLSILELILLLIGRMPLFDAITVTFSTAGTGGFSIHNDGIAYYNGHYYWQAVITTFMVLFGVNFTVYFLLLAKKFKQALKFEELRYYIGWFVCCTVSITAILYHKGVFESLFDCLHHGAFQVATLMSSTGFATQDFDQWPELAKAILVVVAMIGACAGSTGGGFKVSRVVILLKEAAKEIHMQLHPRSVKAVKMDDKPVKHETVRSVSVYLTIFIAVYAVSLLIISIDNFDFTTNFTAVLATLNNMGPGLNMVGPVMNFDCYSTLSKYVLIFDMLAGRLELLPILLMFSPATWKSK